MTMASAVHAMLMGARRLVIRPRAYCVRRLRARVTSAPGALQRVDLLLLAHDGVLEPVLERLGLPGVPGGGVAVLQGLGRLALELDRPGDRLHGLRRELEVGDLGRGTPAEGDHLLDQAPDVLELGL